MLAPAGPRVPGPAAQAALVARAGVAAAADQRDVPRRTGGLASPAVPRGMAAAAGLAVPRGPVVPVDQLVRGGLVVPGGQVVPGGLAVLGTPVAALGLTTLDEAAPVGQAGLAVRAIRRGAGQGEPELLASAAPGLRADRRVTDIPRVRHRLGGAGRSDRAQQRRTTGTTGHRGQSVRAGPSGRPGRAGARGPQAQAGGQRTDTPMPSPQTGPAEEAGDRSRAHPPVDRGLARPTGRLALVLPDLAGMTAHPAAAAERARQGRRDRLDRRAGGARTGPAVRQGGRLSAPPQVTAGALRTETASSETVGTTVGQPGVTLQGRAVIAASVVPELSAERTIGLRGAVHQGGAAMVLSADLILRAELAIGRRAAVLQGGAVMVLSVVPALRAALAIGRPGAALQGGAAIAPSADLVLQPGRAGPAIGRPGAALRGGAAKAATAVPVPQAGRGPGLAGHETDQLAGLDPAAAAATAATVTGGHREKQTLAGTGDQPAAASGRAGRAITSSASGFLRRSLRTSLILRPGRGFGPCQAILPNRSQG
jgi:hypothetical protein